MSNSRKYQIRNAGVGADLASGTNNYKLNRTTGAYDTYTDDASITTTDIVIIGKKSNISDRLDAVEKNITVLAAAAFLTDAEDGIAGSYTIANKLATARTIALTGDVTGSVSFDGSANATISTTIGANTVVLGTDTTGNYVATVTAGSGITVSGSGSETAAITVGIDSTVALKADTHYIGTTSVALNRTSANLALTGISSVTLPGSTSGTVQLIPTAAVGTGTVLTIPATTGTIVTTGDSGTVTNTMLAGSIANSKLANSTISGIQLGSNLAALTIGTGLSGTSYNGSTAVTIANTGVLSVNGSSGTITGIANSADVHYIGTTSVALNRASANLALTGISSVTLPGSTSGTVQLVPVAAVGTGTVLTIPATTGTIVTTGDSGTVTNTMLAGSIANAKLTNSSVTVGTTAISLGSSSTTLAGLTSVTSTSFVGALTGNASTVTNGVYTTDTGTVTNTMLAGSIANAKLVNSSVTVGTTAISLGSSSTTLAGLTSVTSTSFTGALTGNASTATTLQTPRAIQGVNFDGSAAITVVTAGTGISVSGTAVTNTGVTSIAGTANQITASASTGGVTLSLPSSVTLPGDLTITGNLTINGSTITANSANAAYTDSLIELNYINGGVLTSDNGKDIGFRFHYYKTSDKNAALVFDNTTQALEYFVDGTETTGTFSGTYGNYKGATFIAAATTGTAPFTVSSTTRVANLNVATAGTADTLTTARLINGVSFNGSADITVHTAGTGISISGTTVTNAGVTSLTTSSGLSANTSATGAVSITNTGVTSNVAGTGISVSGATGAVTITNTGVTSAAVSGTGLSISGATGGVTITSNATSANTVSTIVARDASGNFSAGTITATLSGNATTATTATTTTGNAGTATTLQTARNIQGVSFNGSADITVVTAGTGIGVSGTTVTNNGVTSNVAGTGISVSGATGAVTITNSGVTSLVAGTNIAVSGSTGAVTVSVSGTVASATAVPSYDRDRTLASTLPTTFGQSVRFDFVNASAIGTNGNYGGVMTFAPYTGTSASTGDASYQLAFGSTATNGSGTPRLRIRNGIDSTWNSFYEVLTAANYNSYSPTLTGTGASGTWGISITGNAATLGGYAPNTTGGANLIVQRDSNGYIQNNYFYTSGGGSERNASGMSYFAGFNSSDYYIRSYTPAAVASAISGQTMNINGSSTSCSGNSSTATTATNTSSGTVNGNYLGVHNTSGSTGYGLSLYNGAVAGQPTYGIFFGQTATWGTHGNVTADWATYFTMDATANRGWIFRDVTNGNKASISNTGNATFAGEVTAYSDARLKTNIATIDKALDKVVKLRGVYFDKDGKRQIGVIAQEIREVFPEVVGEANDEMKTLHVNHGAMVGALIESTKDLNDKIEAQAKEIAELKALVQQLLSTK
jgi:hypothetical protein